MNAFCRFLFPMKSDSTSMSLFLLALRILFGLLLLSHGIQKWSNFSEMSATFPDPLGVGHAVSLGLAIFGELFCSVGFIFGALYRLALIPMIFTMCVAYFVIHGTDPFAAKELPFIYMVVFVLMYITGPGKFALDQMIAKAISKKKM